MSGKLKVYRNLEQRSEEWFKARCGIVTASTVHALLTTTGKVADNDQSRSLTLTLAAERITGNVEEGFQSEAMLRGVLDEPIARDLYSEHHAKVEEVGFMVRDFSHYKIGYSPDGLVGQHGLIEIKSRAQKKHLRTILEDRVPPENMAQLQCGLLVSGRDWIDYVSYCGGMPLWTKRVHPDADAQYAILRAVERFEGNVHTIHKKYAKSVHGLPITERIDHFPELVI